MDFEEYGLKKIPVSQEEDIASAYGLTRIVPPSPETSLPPEEEEQTFHIVDPLQEGIKNVAKAGLGMGKLGADLLQNIGETEENQLAGFKQNKVQKLIESGIESDVLKRDPDYKKSTGIRGYGEDFLEMFPMLAAQYGLAATPGGLPASALFSASQIAGGQYNELSKDETIPAMRAIGASLMNAIGQASLETTGIAATGLAKVFKLGKAAIAGKAPQALKKIAGSMGIEFFTETIQKYPELATNIWAESQDVPIDKQFDKFVEGFWQATKEGMYEGSVAMLGGGVASGINIAANRHAERKAANEIMSEKETAWLETLKRSNPTQKTLEKIRESLPDGSLVIPHIDELLSKSDPLLGEGRAKVQEELDKFDFGLFDEVAPPVEPEFVEPGYHGDYKYDAPVELTEVVEPEYVEPGYQGDVDVQREERLKRQRQIDKFDFSLEDVKQAETVDVAEPEVVEPEYVEPGYQGDVDVQREERLKRQRQIDKFDFGLEDVKQAETVDVAEPEVVEPEYVEPGYQGYVDVQREERLKRQRQIDKFDFGLEDVKQVDVKQPAKQKAGRTAESEQGIHKMPIGELVVDEEKFQYKRFLGKGGVSSKLKSLKKYNKELGGVVSVWKNPVDGKDYVINGHHRFDLAKRSGEKTLEVRHIEAPDAESAKLKGALINIAEGQGTAEDAALIFKQNDITPEMITEKYGVSLKGAIAKEGMALSGLSPSLFSKVDSGKYPKKNAIIIGENLRGDFDAQAELVKLLEKQSRKRIITPEFIRYLIHDIKSGSVSTKKEVTVGLFGDVIKTRPLLMERAELMDYAVKRLGDTKKLFKTVSSETSAKKLGEKGNLIEAGKNKEEAQAAEDTAKTLKNLYRYKGKTNDALNKYAEALSNEKTIGNKNAVKQIFFGKIKDAVQQEIKGGKETVSDGVKRDDSRGKLEAGKQLEVEKPVLESKEAPKIDDDISSIKKDIENKIKQGKEKIKHIRKYADDGGKLNKKDQAKIDNHQEAIEEAENFLETYKQMTKAKDVDPSKTRPDKIKVATKETDTTVPDNRQANEDLRREEELDKLIVKRGKALDKAKENHLRMKEANKIIKNKKLSPDEKTEAMKMLYGKEHDSEVDRLFIPGVHGRVGFNPVLLAKSNKKIKKMALALDKLRSRKVVKADVQPQIESKPSSQISKANAQWNKDAQAVLEKGSNIKQVHFLSSNELASKIKELDVDHPAGDVKGFYVPDENSIYINKDISSKDTIYHEFAHPYLNHMKVKNPLIYRQGTSLIKGTRYESDARDAGYGNYLDEALTQAIGEKGAKIQSDSQKNKFMSWLKRLVDRFNAKIKKLIPGNKEMTLDDYTTAMVQEIVSGKKQVNTVRSSKKAQFMVSGKESKPDSAAQAAMDDYNKIFDDSVAISPKDRKANDILKKVIDNIPGRYLFEKTEIEGKKKSLSLISHILGTTMYNSQKKPDSAYGRLYGLFKKSSDFKKDKQNELRQSGADSLFAPLVAFKKESKLEYAKFNNYLNKNDIDATGYTVVEKGKEFIVLNKKGEDVGKESNSDEAWAIARELEAAETDLGDRGKEALMKFRTMTRNLYKHFSQEMEMAQALAKEAGVTLPDVKVYDDGKKKYVNISLKNAIVKMGNKQGYYFPRLRDSGQYKVEGTKKDVNPEMQFFNTALGARGHAGRLEKQGYSTLISHVGLTSENIFQSLAPLLSQEQIINKTLESLDGKQTDVDTDSFKVAFAKNFTDQYIAQLKGHGSRARMIGRSDAKGLSVKKGYETDPVLAIAQATEAAAGGAAKKRIAMEGLEIITGRDVSYEQFKAMKGNKDVDHKDYLEFVKDRRIDESRERLEYKEATNALRDILKNKEYVDKVVDTLKALAVVKYLGGRVSSAAVNTTNMATGVIGAIKGENGVTFGNAFKSVGSALMRYGKFRAGTAQNSPKQKQMNTVFKYIEKKGWDDPQFNTEALDALRSQSGNLWESVLRKSMYFFGVTEKINRASTIAASYISLCEKNKVPLTDKDGNLNESFMQQSVKVSDFAHGDYTKANRPDFLRGDHIGARAGQVGYVFHTFSHNYLQEMARLGLQKKDYGAALYMALSGGAIAGVGAAVPLAVLSALMELMGGDDPEEALIKSITSLTGGVGGDLLRSGAAGMIGIELKGSLGMDFTPKENVFDLLGAVPSMLSDVYQGTKNITEGYYREGFEKIMPSAIGSISKAFREREGATTRSGSPVFFEGERVKGDNYDTMVRALSFNPVDIASKKEFIWKSYKKKALYQKAKTKINTRLKRFYSKPPSQRDLADIVDIKADMRDFNQEIIDKNLRGLISPFTKKSIKNMLRRSMRPTKIGRLKRDREE